MFTNVSSVWLRAPDSAVYDAFATHASPEAGVVVVQNGRIVCQGPGSQCASAMDADAEMIDLDAGSLQPGLVSVGSSLGLQEIAMEPSTVDGLAYNLLAGDPPAIAGGAGYVPRAADGLIYGTRDALYVPTFDAHAACLGLTGTTGSRTAEA